MPRRVRTPAQDALDHAEFHARESDAGIGAAVWRADFEDGERVWDCIVADGHEWHFIRVVGVKLGSYPNLSTEDVEEGIISYATMLPAQGRIHRLVNANPLHIERRGAVVD
jgi:hypothetical protein